MPSDLEEFITAKKNGDFVTASLLYCNLLSILEINVEPTCRANGGQAVSDMHI